MSVWRAIGYSQTPLLLDAARRKSVLTMLNSPEERARRPWLLDEVLRQVTLVPALSLLCIVLVVLLIYMVHSLDVLHNSLVFTPDEIRLEVPVCPGERIVYERQLYVRESLVVEVYSQVIDAESGAPVSLLERLWLLQPREANAIVPMNVDLIVPAYPPGHYVHTTGAVGEGTRAAFSHVFFEVATTCGPLANP